MDASLSRGYAAQLIDRMPCALELNNAIKNGLSDKVYNQYYEVCYTKKPDTIARKMRRASGGRMRVRIPSWTKNRKTVVLDCITGDSSFTAHSYFNPEHVRYSEKSIVMNTIFCERKNDDFKMFHLCGPSMGQHAVSRILQRKAATVETLRATCHAALSRAREAVALLKEEDDVYKLLLPFAHGAIAVEVHGNMRTPKSGPKPPSLSVRTYLTDKMLTDEQHERIQGLDEFYADNAWSDTKRYRSLLEENRRFLGLSDIRAERIKKQLEAVKF